MIVLSALIYLNFSVMTSKLNHGGTSFKTINETGALSLDPLSGVRINQYEFQVLYHFPMEQ